jgi:hypothetical protein
MLALMSPSNCVPIIPYANGLSLAYIIIANASYGAQKEIFFAPATDKIILLFVKW